jgi:hypothetical protein
MPFRTTGNDHFSLNGRLTTLAARAEEFMEIQMAVKVRNRRFVRVVLESFGATSKWFLVESNTFKSSMAVEADKALRMESGPSSRHDLTRDRMRA